MAAELKKRDSNLELFRIIVMFMIVLHHYVVSSGLMALDGPIYAAPLSAQSLYLLLMGAWGKTGINCFVLITGYFMCKSNITAKKFVKLLAEVMFYNIVIFSIFTLTGYAPFSLSELARAFIPVLEVKDNFVSSFLVFFLFIPFLNVLIHNLNEKKHLLLLALCGFTYVFLGIRPFFNVTMNYVSWFSVLYILAAYIRLYPKKLFESKKFWGTSFALSSLLGSASVVGCAWISARFNRTVAYGYVSDSNALLALLIGLSAFMLFKNIHVKYNRVINAVGATTFGILLIHSNCDTMRQWLWKDVFGNVDLYGQSFIYVHAILATLAVFIACSCIDMLRIRFVEKPFLAFYDKKEPVLRSKIQRIDEWFCKKINIENETNGEKE